jgi:uncharacterized protein YcfL
MKSVPKMLSVWTAVACCVIAALALSACQTKIVYNPDVINVVEVQKDRVNGLLKAQIAVQNNSPTDRQIEYRFRWFSAGHMQVDTQLSNWNTVYSRAGEIVRLNGTAPNAEVTDFEYDIQYAKRD